MNEYYLLFIHLFIVCIYIFFITSILSVTTFPSMVGLALITVSSTVTICICQMYKSQCKSETSDHSFWQNHSSSIDLDRNHLHMAIISHSADAQLD